MQVNTAVPTRVAYSAAPQRKASVPAEAGDRFSASAPSPPTHSLKLAPAGFKWRQSTSLQMGAWTVTGLAATLTGAVAGPQVGLLLGGALGAAAGIYCDPPKASFLEKAAAATWGFGIVSALGIIGSASIIGGSFASILNGGASGYASAQGSKPTPGQADYSISQV